MNAEDQLKEALARLARATELLQKCEAGFGAFVMGRRLARKDRDRLRGDIQAWLIGRRGSE